MFFNEKNVFLKLIDIFGYVSIELLTAVIGLLIALVPAWRWGRSFIKKQKEKTDLKKKKEKEFFDKIDYITNTLNLVKYQLASHIAKDMAEMSLSDTPIFICNEDGKCTEANPALCRVFGATREQMIGYGWTQYIIPEDREGAVKRWNAAVKTDTDITDNYTINVGLNGKLAHVTYRAVISRDESGNVIHILGKVRRIRVKRNGKS